MPEDDRYVGRETDEMYTQYVDVVNELDHYPDELFLGKKILFPCDWDAIYNCGDKIQFEAQNRINHILNVDTSADIPKCNFLRYFWDTYGKYKENKTELYASGYNPTINDPNRLSCMEIDYSKFDWVITNASEVFGLKPGNPHKHWLSGHFSLLSFSNGHEICRLMAA